MMKKFTMILFAAIALMLVSFTAGMEYVRGDVDQDGTVSVADVTCLIDYLLTGSWDSTPVTPPDPQDEHEWVDLGLPSGTLWATCNVGASSPEEYGDYFAWGETEPKGTYNWSTYKWCNGTATSFTKYCDSSSYGYNGFVDNKTELDLEDDAAYVNWGEEWQIPTWEQLLELKNSCLWNWTTYKGIKGYVVTGLNGETLFLPAAGCYDESSLKYSGNWGHYWSRMQHSYYHGTACALFFFSENQWGKNYLSRYYGFTVRAVRVKD